MEEIIIGLHSIVEALQNPKREKFALTITEDAWRDLKSNYKIEKERLNEIQLSIVSGHELQERAKRDFQKFDYHYTRIPSGLYLTTEPIEQKNINDVYDYVDQNKHLRLICLDQITDVHNAAAILRSSSFFGVDFLCVSSKKNFGIGPSFYRIASGAVEHVPIVTINNLSKFISKLQDKNVTCLGLMEEGEEAKLKGALSKTCLVLGSEDKGLSHAVRRVIEHKISLNPRGQIKTLNVSVAASVAMQKFFPV